MKATAKCIFCLKETGESNSSREHVLPDALGGNLILSKDCCCDKCNSELGSQIDAKIVDLFQIQRVIWDIRSTKNKSNEPTVKGFIYLDDNRRADGVKRPKQWPSISHTTKLDENTWIFPNEDAKIKFLNDCNRKGKSVELCPAGEISLSNFGSKDLRFSDFHERALTKVAYNLVAYVLGADIARDNLFGKVRNYITSGAEKVLISYSDTQSNYSPINLAGPPQHKTPYLPHYLSLASTKDRRLLGIISIFGFNYVIVLCENWELTTHWLGYLYYVNRFTEIIPNIDIHKYLATDYWSVCLGPLFPLLSEDDRKSLSPQNNCKEFLMGFLELDNLHAG